MEKQQIRTRTDAIKRYARTHGVLLKALPTEALKQLAPGYRGRKRNWVDAPGLREMFDRFYEHAGAICQGLSPAYVVNAARAPSSSTKCVLAMRFDREHASIVGVVLYAKLTPEPDAVLPRGFPSPVGEVTVVCAREAAKGVGRLLLATALVEFQKKADLRGVYLNVANSFQGVRFATVQERTRQFPSYRLYRSFGFREISVKSRRRPTQASYENIVHMFLPRDDLRTLDFGALLGVSDDYTRLCDRPRQRCI